MRFVIVLLDAASFCRVRGGLVSGLCSGSCVLHSSLSDSIEQLTGLRFVAGVDFGAMMPNAVAMTDEYYPHRRRPTAVNRYAH